MATDRGLPALISGYLNALEEADRFDADGLTDEAQKQRESAASLYATIDRVWPPATIEAAYRQAMSKVFTEWQSQHEKHSSRASLRSDLLPGGVMIKP